MNVIDSVLANPVRAMLSPVPTPVLTRLYRKWQRMEAEIAATPLDVRIAQHGGEGPAMDAYDRVADKAAFAYLILRDRGVDVCAYCGTHDGTHPSATCPATLLQRLSIN